MLDAMWSWNLATALHACLVLVRLGSASEDSSKLLHEGLRVGNQHGGNLHASERGAANALGAALFCRFRVALSC